MRQQVNWCNTFYRQSITDIHKTKLETQKKKNQQGDQIQIVERIQRKFIIFAIFNLIFSQHNNDDNNNKNNW